MKIGIVGNGFVGSSVAFSNKDKLNKLIEDEHVFEKKDPHADTTI